MNIREGTDQLNLARWFYLVSFKMPQRELGKMVHPDSHLPDIGESNTVLVDQVVSITQRILDGSGQSGTCEY